MEHATGALISELVKAGLGWLLAAYFYWQLSAEQKDRRKCDADMQTLLLSLKDESHTRVAAVNDRQAESFAKVGDALAALTVEVRGRPCQIEGGRLALPPPREGGAP